LVKTKLIVNLTRGGAVCVSELADSPLPRMRGLIGRRGLPAGEGLLLRPAPAIHTAFMRFPIDALFLDGEMKVVQVVERLRPWRMASFRSARAVLELSAGESARRGVAVGDRLELRDRQRSEAGQGSDSRTPAGERLGDLQAPDRALDWPELRLARLRPLRILVTSGDRRFRTVMSLLLARRNCSVTATANPGRLTELVLRERTDVVIVDAEEDLACARAITALDALEDPVGVVIVSDHEERVNGREAIAKWGPFERLIAAIEHADEHRDEGSRTR
jgi:hypothetical protein